VTYFTGFIGHLVYIAVLSAESHSPWAAAHDNHTDVNQFGCIHGRSTRQVMHEISVASNCSQKLLKFYSVIFVKHSISSIITFCSASFSIVLYEKLLRTWSIDFLNLCENCI